MRVDEAFGTPNLEPPDRGLEEALVVVRAEALAKAQARVTAAEAALSAAVSARNEALPPGWSAAGLEISCSFRELERLRDYPPTPPPG